MDVWFLRVRWVRLCMYMRCRNPKHHKHDYSNIFLLRRQAPAENDSFLSLTLLYNVGFFITIVDSIHASLLHSCILNLVFPTLEEGSVCSDRLESTRTLANPEDLNIVTISSNQLRLIGRGYLWLARTFHDREI